MLIANTVRIPLYFEHPWLSQFTTMCKRVQYDLWESLGRCAKQELTDSISQHTVKG